MNNFTLPGQISLPNLNSSLGISIENAFENFLRDEVDCKLSDVQQVIKSHNNLRNILQNKIKTDDKFPWLLYNKDFISGSAGRGTRIAPPKDVDIMLPLDGTGLKPIENGYYLNAVIEGSGYYGSPISNLTDGNGYISSHKVLEQVKSSLKISFPSSEIRRDGQAVTINFRSYMDSDGLNFDIVPCFYIIPNDSLTTPHYYIPVGYGSHFWKKTNPTIDKVICDMVDNAHNLKIKPAIRLIKKWNELMNLVPLTSYHLDVICWKIFNNSKFKLISLSAAVTNFFFNAESYLNVPCPDYSNLNNEAIDQYLTFENRKKVLEAVQKAKSSIIAALSAELFSKNNVLAILHWKNIFGSEFGKEYRWLQNS